MASLALVGSKGRIAHLKPTTVTRPRRLAPKRNVVVASTFKITFKLPSGEEKTIDCPDDV
jgi:hypothetical protein